MTILQEHGLEETDAEFVKPGDKFGRLTVVATGQQPDTYRYMAICFCSCGSGLKRIRCDHLQSRVTTSCGCYHREQVTTHGLKDSPHYDRWKGMLSRCANVDDSAYENYGGRQIKVCGRWHDLRNYVADLPDGYRDGLELDRIDNDGDYDPGNVRWTTRQKNCENRRSTRWLTFEGRTLSISEWEREKKLPHGMINNRLDELGWSVERALAETVADLMDNMRRAQSLRWSGHIKRPSPKPLIAKTFMFNGRMQTIREISQYTGISQELLRKRLCERKWPIDKATRDGTHGGSNAQER